MAAAIVLIPTLAVTGSLHLAGGRADSHSLNSLGREVSARPATNVDTNPSVDPQVLYWKAKAVKRLRLAQWFEQKRNDWRSYAKHLKGGDARVHHLSTARVSGGVRGAICTVFGAHCSEALRVAWCESRMNVYANNGGVYLGLFQFGPYARSKYGFAWNAWTQARAAYRYFLDAGWSAWTCKP